MFHILGMSSNLGVCVCAFVNTGPRYGRELHLFVLRIPASSHAQVSGVSGGDG